jgi:hypothetical protein
VPNSVLFVLVWIVATKKASKKENWEGKVRKATAFVSCPAPASSTRRQKPVALAEKLSTVTPEHKASASFVPPLSFLYFLLILLDLIVSASNDLP